MKRIRSTGAGVETSSVFSLVNNAGCRRGVAAGVDGASGYTGMAEVV